VKLHLYKTRTKMTEFKNRVLRRKFRAKGKEMRRGAL
jgi:hypothetical protein